MPLRHEAPAWGRWTTVVTLVCVLAAPVWAQPRKKPASTASAPDATATAPAAAPDAKADPTSGGAASASKGKKSGKVQNFDLNAIDFNGRNRTPQLLYFLERANEELERASLERRSFIPHRVRSRDEEQL
jgi:hypothetical protein